VRPALASCEFEPPAVLLVVNLSFVMRSSSCSRLPLKYPPRQAEYFYGYSRTNRAEPNENYNRPNKPKRLGLPALHNLAIRTLVVPRLCAQG
jgi:hypothetical protein